jgi:predicted membrane-bound dolichyl-phosphate-mannose-protein mannosyltransferase
MTEGASTAVRETNTPAFVVHPPLGKWMITAGIWGSEKLRFLGIPGGDNSYGWRISCVIAGVISVVVVARAARRLFRSTVLGCAAGLLMALDGFHFVLSRAAILDIFVLFWVLLACLILDRDPSTAALAASDRGSAARRRKGPPPEASQTASMAARPIFGPLRARFSSPGCPLAGR